MQVKPKRLCYLDHMACTFYYINEIINLVSSFTTFTKITLNVHLELQMYKFMWNLKTCSTDVQSKNNSIELKKQVTEKSVFTPTYFPPNLLNLTHSFLPLPLTVPES